jgi:sugar lactone lactonase YvrE
MAVLSEPECVWPLEAELGEGPIWWPEDQSVWFVDIKGPRIHRWSAETGEGRSWDAPDQVTFIKPIERGGMLAGVRGGLYRFDPADGSFQKLATVEPDRPQNRSNDAVVDVHGRLWFGSMDDSEAGISGALWRWDGAGDPILMDDGYHITNGPAVSADGRTLYCTDTLKNVIYAFDLDADGALSNKRTFIAIEEGSGHPDGPTADVSGLWTALFGGWAARRYDAAGHLVETARFPCPNVTKLAFGGPELKTVYATTARLFMTPEARAEHPLSGGLFRFQVDTPGLPQRAVKLR